MKKEITNSVYWSKRWGKTKIPITKDLKKNPIYLMSRLFDKFVDGSRNMIEIGCAPGGWMYYFYKKHNMFVSGIEYSKIGYVKTKKNLHALDVKNFNLIFGDFLKYDFKQKYDLVLSLGFIEHFNDPKEIIKKHLDILSDKGILIISVPNFDQKNKSSNYLLQKLINKEDLYNHNLSITNLQGLNDICKSLKLKIKFIGHIGGVNLGITNFGSKLQILSKTFYLFNSILTRFLKIVEHKKESKFLSPYVFVVIEK